MRARVLLPVCLLLLSCSGAEDISSTSVPASTPSSTASTTGAPATTAASTTSTTVPASLVETLDDGRPATFLAVTTDYEAVEVGTETGTVVHSFGRRGDAASLDEDYLPQVVDAVWRTVDGRHVLVSECCEPAAGRINVIEPNGSLSPEYDDRSAYGWAAVPSPVDARVLIVGYSTAVVEPQEPDDSALCDSFVIGACWTGEGFLENNGSGIAAIGWNHDGVRVHWYDPGSENLLTWDGDGGQLSRAPLTWVADDQALVGLSGQASGNVVSFLHTYGPDGEITGTKGVVYSPETGGEVASFEVPPGSVLGGYDPSGTYLIYTTPEGTVAFQGRGRVEPLGEGYFFASW